MNTAEERFLRVYARPRHWHVLRPGWPDFLVIDHRGEMMGIEVKAGQNWVSAEQRETFDLLTLHGFPVWIWHAATPKLLWKWERVKGHRDGRNNRARKANGGNRADPESGPETPS